MPVWLLESSVKQAIEQASQMGVMPTIEQQAVFQANHFDLNSGDAPVILTMAGNTAEIVVRGVITNTPNFLAMIFGGGNTIYPDIIRAIAIAEQNDNIEKIDYLVDSPGGEFDGLFAAIAAIKASKKPSRTIVSNVAASAAYALIAHTDHIKSSNQAARFGSIGVVATFHVNENEIEISNTKSPKKRPDVTTAAGQAVVREQLDPMHDLFVESIAAGRSTTIENINAEFGQGLTFLADDALSRGMIDSIADSSVNRAVPKPRNVGNSSKEAKTMDLNELKAQHPDIYTAVRTEGIDVGVAQERDRVNAHLTMGAAFGDMKTALDAVKDGSEMTATLNATYMAAGMNKDQLKDRLADDAGADAGDGADANAGNATGDSVVSLVEKQFGIGV